MRSTLFSIAGAVALATMLTACGNTGGNGGGGSAAGCTPAESSIEVGALDQLTFDAEAYEADAGCVEITYTNEGSIAHTLLVRGQSGFKLAIGDEDSGSIELDAGSYELYCDVPGHEAAGMLAELTVS